MPSRWLVPLPGIRPQFVQLAHVHAAVSGWFDRTQAEHCAIDKPYAVSPLVGVSEQTVGVEVAALTAEAERRFHEATAPGHQIRLGNQTRHMGKPRRLATRSWTDLAAMGSDDRWSLEFVTPTTFRTGDRASPLPQPSTILHGLATAWRLWSDHEITLLEPRTIAETVWVSQLDLHSAMLQITVGIRQPGRQRDVTVSGVMGGLTLRCADRQAALTVGPLIQLSAFTGVGSMTRKGLGVTRVRAGTHEGSRARPDANGGHDGLAS